jgi:serine/threonine-protein kinase
MLATFGYHARPADWASGLEVDLDQLRHFQTQYPTEWRRLKPEPNFLRFWYRESPQPLEAWRFPYQYGNVSRITPIDPPLDTAGMALVRLDPSGRLTQLLVVPPSAAAAASVLQPDWTAFLAQAGFDSSAWRASQPERNPPVFSDARAAWTGSWPGPPNLPVRLEAAALGGKPVYFEAIYPWTPPPREPATLLTAGERAGVLILFLVAGVTLVAAALFAQRNLRAGRGDRRGAFRLSMFVFATMVVSWLFGESHVATLWEVALVVMALSWASLAAAFCWLAYLAVEPFLRRHWPEVLVTWARLLAGDLSDPLIGRDVLIGCAAGTVLAIVGILGFVVPVRFGMPSDLTFADVYGVVYRVQGVLPLLVWRAAQAVLAGLGTVFLLLLCRMALHSHRAAIITFVAANGVIAGLAAPSFWIPFASTAIHVGVFVWLIVRFGLLAAVVQFYVWGLFIFFPLTADLNTWYAGAGVTAAFVLATLTLGSFRTALGGRSALGKTALE